MRTNVHPLSLDDPKDLAAAVSVEVELVPHQALCWTEVLEALKTAAVVD